MSSTLVQPDCSAEKPRPSVAALRLPPLEKALIPVCAELAISQAYFAVLRLPGDVQAPRLLLAVSGAEIAKQRRLAAAVAEMLPDDVELELIELSDDEFCTSLRQSCTPFYSR